MKRPLIIIVAALGLLAASACRCWPRIDPITVSTSANGFVNRRERRMRHDCNSISATTTTTTTRRAAMRLHRSQGAASASDSAVATGSSTAPCGSSPSAAGLWSPCRRSASWFRCYRPTTPPCGSAERRTTTPMASTTPRPRVRTMWWSRRPPPGGAESVQPVPAAPAPCAMPEPIIYPRSGQTAAQTEADRQECNRWATTQPSVMPDASVFQRSVAAYMDGRGYTVRCSGRRPSRSHLSQGDSPLQQARHTPHRTFSCGICRAVIQARNPS